MKENRYKTIEQIFRDGDTDEEFMRWPPQDQELTDANKLNEDYRPDPPKKEHPYLNFIDFDKYGVIMQNE